MLQRYICFFFFIWFTAALQAEEKSEKLISTQITLGLENIHYQCRTGFLTIYSEEKKPQASIFYVAYHKEKTKDQEKQPVTFCLGGDLGFSSVGLHLGGLGPKKMDFSPSAIPLSFLGYSDNPYSILDVTDLVFIDPISTGFSRPFQGVEAKTFYNVKEDIKVLAEFIRQYTTQNKLWNAPKILLGEGYGGFRAAGLASYLHDHYFLYLNGLILLAPTLNFQTLEDPDRSNDLPYPLFLPSYTAAAAFHKKIADPKDLLEEAENFASHEYRDALFKGDYLSPADQNKMAHKLSAYTGLPSDYLLRAELRIPLGKFEYEFLKQKNLTLGRYDSRYQNSTLWDTKSSSSVECTDPSLIPYLSAFTIAIQSYLSRELSFALDDDTYRVVASVCPWDFGRGVNQYPSMADRLRYVMTKNPHLHVFVATGLYDLVTPYYGVEYAFNHLGLDSSLHKHLHMKRYLSGHMIYLDAGSLPKLKKDLSTFYQEAIPHVD